MLSKNYQKEQQQETAVFLRAKTSVNAIEEKIQCCKKCCKITYCYRNQLALK